MPLDKSVEATLNQLYDMFNTKDEISVSSPEFKQTEVDFLIGRGLLKKIDASTLSGWAYIVMPTHEGETYFSRQLEQKRGKRKHIFIEIIKFAIPTIISIIALIVSILK